MGQAYSGVGGTVSSGGVDMEVEGYSFDAESVDIDTTVTSDAGWEDGIYGPKNVSGSFDFFIQAAKTPFGAVAQLFNPYYPTLSLGAGPGPASGKARILKISVKSATKDAIKCTATFKSKQAWTLPT